MAKFSDLLGKTIVKIEGDIGDDEILFYTDTGEKYMQYHEQDCCEIVDVNDIVGDYDDLIGAPLLMADEVSKEGDSEGGTSTWTFYKLATVNGYVTIKWYGESNGYYSESVDFKRVD